ncbi:hypothetical protein BJ322DRAFT_1025311 [Thelephora terrestris]|uniref:Uncharacterized protein n=1 Tax=Thelephora terrestris TaxID=56493 RepID=A0A9P6H2T2_9AGAM|nr:hypothetical protein BJ322DRAFT_1025311 [Thelephora terrestris]
MTSEATLEISLSVHVNVPDPQMYTCTLNPFGDISQSRSATRRQASPQPNRDPKLPRSMSNPFRSLGLKRLAESKRTTHYEQGNGWTAVIKAFQASGLPLNIQISPRASADPCASCAGSLLTIACPPPTAYPISPTISDSPVGHERVYHLHNSGGQPAHPSQTSFDPVRCQREGVQMVTTGDDHHGVTMAREDSEEQVHNLRLHLRAQPTHPDVNVPEPHTCTLNPFGDILQEHLVFLILDSSSSLTGYWNGTMAGGTKPFTAASSQLSQRLRQRLEDLDFSRQMYGVVVDTARSVYQRSFLTIMDVLSQDVYWHPYLRKAMDIWLPFRCEGP